MKKLLQLALLLLLAPVAAQAQFSLGGSVQINDQAASATTVVCPSATYTAGQVIFIGVSGASTATITGVAGGSNTYTQVAGAYNTLTSEMQDIWRVDSALAGTYTITATYSVSTEFRSINCARFTFTGDGTPTFDAGGTIDDTADPMLTDSFNPAAADSLVYIYAHTPGNNGPTSPTTGYTALHEVSGFSSSYDLDVATGAQTAGFNSSLGSTMLSHAIFNPPAGGATPPPTQMMMGIGALLRFVGIFG